MEIQVELVYGLISCFPRFGCRTSFDLYYYATNTTQPSSTIGSGFTNTDNYKWFATVRQPSTIDTFTETYNFTLQANVTGFYIAIRDTGTCVGISRMRVYRNNCQLLLNGLLHSDAPAPASDLENTPYTCQSNSMCDQPGYEKQESECVGKRCLHYIFYTLYWL